MLESWFVTKMTKLSVKRTSYGDFARDSATPSYDVYARFRLYSENERVDGAMEQGHESFAQAWFKPTDDIQENDILLYDGAYWEVMRVRKAKRGKSDNVLFLKCELLKHAVVS